MQNTGMQGSTPAAASGERQAEDLTERAGAKLSQLSDTAQQAMERFSHAASKAAWRLGETGEELWGLQGRALDTARSYAREHPVATIGIAVAVGLLLSRLLTRR